ncbi:MAG: N-methyl-L-tryptophan oxidase [Elusimicrobia bacterium]|nr:N-methyl-L-tryptophan oxidase [Elusimicrobiota bacterium]
MSDKHGVIVVGGGIMGVSAAYWLAQKGQAVTLLDQYDIPNQWAASGDHLRVFRLTYGKDAFYTDMALKTLPLWLDLNTQTGEKILQQNGVLELATVSHGYEEHSLNVLKELKLPVQRLEKNDLKRHYPMINSRAVKWGLFHKDGGMLWASKAVTHLASLAQRKGAKFRSRVKITQVLRDKKEGIRGLKDEHGRLHVGESYLFAGGMWTPELLKSYGIPIKVTRQYQLYLRPPANRGRYRPEHFPVFASLAAGFYGFPLHLHGFMKIGDHRKGPIAKPGKGGETELPQAFEKKCRAFLKRFIPELTNFTEYEGHVCHYDNTKDDDFILDRLPDAPNGFIAAGFSGHGFKFGPLIGKTMADLVVGGKPELNLHRFRLGRFKRR